MSGTYERGLLFFGDLSFFSLALWVTLLLRYAEVPGRELLLTHGLPFGLLFVVWALVFFIAGLYDRQLAVFERTLPQTIFYAQTVNVLIAALFFFLVPFFGITPKTILFIYLLVSSLLVIGWRISLFPQLASRKKQGALLIASGVEADELMVEINENSRYGIRFVLTIDPETLESNEAFQTLVLARAQKEGIAFVVADTMAPRFKPLLPVLYNLTFLGFHFSFIDMRTLYEQVFSRIPLSSLEHGWFLGTFAQAHKRLYGACKRVFDIAGAIVLGAVVVILMPFVYLAMRLEDGGPLFIPQMRIGRFNKPMTVYKFRTMRFNEAASDKWIGESENQVTRVGAVLRTTSIDEFPQVWNILKGELSFIGPRNDIAGLGARLAEAIPYYNTRYVVKPGISGWAQINQHYAPGSISPQSLEETKFRLAYDLFYIKNRSLFLDLEIALKTIKTLFVRFSTLFTPRP